jgi:hypothetical protein
LAHYADVCRLSLLLGRDQAPWQARAQTFAAVAAALGDCMATRFACPETGLWRAAAEAFNSIVASGLPAVNIAYVNGDGEPPDAAWPALAGAFRKFLLGSHLAERGRQGSQPLEVRQPPPPFRLTLSTAPFEAALLTKADGEFNPWTALLI